MQAALHDLFNEVAADARGGGPVGFGEGVEREGNGGDAHDGAFRGGGYGAGVEDADAGVGAEVDAAQDQVGLGVEQEADSQFDAVGRGAADGGAEVRAAGGPGARVEGLGEGDAVADGRAFAVGGDDVNFAQILDGAMEGVDAGGLNAVVVGNQNAHDGR